MNFTFFHKTFCNKISIVLFLLYGRIYSYEYDVQFNLHLYIDKQSTPKKELVVIFYFSTQFQLQLQEKEMRGQ